MVILKENNFTSCLLICWLTLTALLWVNESLSRTFPSTVDVFQQTAVSCRASFFQKPSKAGAILVVKFVESEASLSDKEGFHL